jgi:signal transduction histidine kinase
VIALELIAVTAARMPAGTMRGFTVYAWLMLLAAALVLVVWLVSDSRTFWALYPLAGLGFALAFPALFVFADRVPGAGRRELSERVDQLTRSRRGALDVQDAQLRRIERDLHDGAQARLVALTMQIGRAQEQLERTPAATAALPDLESLLRGANQEAQAAISELRELARGIAPPLLADRGLAESVKALAERSAAGVTVETKLDRRLPTVIETAAYFIVAESLTNVAKHAPGASIRLSVCEVADRLLIDVSDDGPGGADPAGGGLAGLSQRAAALDGTMAVDSPAGAGTTIHVELPCGL